MLHCSITVEVSPGSPVQECFNKAATKYITCSPVNGRPASCDCTEKKTCYIKMILSKRNGSGTPEYLVNQTLQGPTIIVKQYNFVIVDFANEMDENTSIHFHGMKQEDNNWADGTGDITQYPIPAYGKFRYVTKNGMAYSMAMHTKPQNRERKQWIFNLKYSRFSRIF